LYNHNINKKSSLKGLKPEDAITLMNKEDCMLPNFFMMLCAVFMGAALPDWSQASEKTVEPAEFSAMISNITFELPLDFCGEKVPIENSDVYERLEKQFLFFVWRRHQVILWMKRSSRYMPYIEKRLKENNMPEDLKYVPIVESALLPHIGSPKNAVGFWQFIKATGLRFGLTVNSDIDERRNIYKSTEAAIAYFRKLYGDFSSWTLAAAAYNMGETGLRSNIEFQKTDDFYHLYLPLETQDYILSIVAAKIILSDPDKYGFRFSKEDLYAPAEFDLVQVQCSDNTSLQIVAEAAGTYFKTIKDLNPEFRGRYLPGGNYSIAIPKGAAESFQAKYETLIRRDHEVRQAEPEAKKEPVAQKRFYVVKRGDSLTAIAQRFNVSLSELMAWNRLKHQNHIEPGKRLIVGD